MTDEEYPETDGMHTVSSNGFSTDLQVADALAFLRTDFPEDYARVRREFPENLVFGDHSSWLDTEAMGVDEEWSAWLCDAIEATGRVLWVDGEPWGESK